EASRRPSGTRNRIERASAVSSTSSATSRLWKVTLKSHLSVAFEQVERLRAVAAAPEGLARGRAETADLLRLHGPALRAVHRAFGRRGDAVSGELGPAFRGDPVGGPGGREHGLDRDVAVAGGVERIADVAFDDVAGRAA